MQPDEILHIRNLTLGYGSGPILSGVDMTVRPSEFWCWIGANGSGKTTLLRGILGLLDPQRGELALSPRLNGRARLGYVPQRCQLNPSLPTTVREFVGLGFVESDVPRSERAEALAWALRQVDLGELMDQSYWSLSGGQRQRALVARALVRRPDLLVLDEPTEGLDVTTQNALLETLRTLHQERGLTLLVVTHRLEIAARFASHVAFFASGGVTAGPRAEVLQRPDVANSFQHVELVGT